MLLSVADFAPHGLKEQASLSFTNLSFHFKSCPFGADVWPDSSSATLPFGFISVPFSIRVLFQWVGFSLRDGQHWAWASASVLLLMDTLELTPFKIDCFDLLWPLESKGLACPRDFKSLLHITTKNKHSHHYVYHMYIPYI